MPEALEVPELERTKLYQQLQALGDFRPASFRSTFADAARTTALIRVQVTPGTDPNTCGYRVQLSVPSVTASAHYFAF